MRLGIGRALPARAQAACRATTDERRSPLRRVADIVLFNVLLCTFGIMCLAWSLPAAALSWIVPRSRRNQVGQFGIMTGFRIYLWIMRVAGLARFDLAAIDALAGQGAMVIVCNHRSLLDAVLIISRLPRIVCITKAGLWDNRFLGGGIRMAGYIRNDAPLALIRAAAGALRVDDQQLLIFPEGTRSGSARPGPFKAGFAIIARTARVPVQTVILETNSPYLQKGWGLFRQPSFPLIYRARLGRRFDVTGNTDDFVADLERYVRDEVTLSPALH
jgi:1-acyl-sn-glycerol-3-phosphate acyltransferase